MSQDILDRLAAAMDAPSARIVTEAPALLAEAMATIVALNAHIALLEGEITVVRAGRAETPDGLSYRGG